LRIECVVRAASARVTEGSSQQILKADRSEDVKGGPEVFLEHEVPSVRGFSTSCRPGDWSVPKAMLRLGSFWYASFKCSRE
jgi:hypothetical protein